MMIKIDVTAGIIIKLGFAAAPRNRTKLEVFNLSIKKCLQSFVAFIKILYRIPFLAIRTNPLFQQLVKISVVTFLTVIKLETRPPCPGIRKRILDAKMDGF